MVGHATRTIEITMNGQAKEHPLNRLTGLLRSSKTGSARLMLPKSAALAAAGDDGLSHYLREWAHTSARIPWLGEADYQYRLGSHRLNSSQQTGKCSVA
jgi:hypothetical protein